MEETTGGCGQPSHSPECLCDVVVKAPTPVNYSLTETWQYERIANALGDPFGEAPDIGTARQRFVDFYEQATRAYDATRGLEDGGQIFVGRGQVEDSLRPAISAALKLGYSMTEMSELFEVPRSRIVFEIARVNGGVRDWTDDDWRAFEQAINVDPTPTMRSLHERFNIGKAMLQTLYDLYGKERRTTRPTTPDWVYEYIADHLDTPPRVVLQELLDMGADVNRSMVKNYRERCRAGLRAAHTMAS